MTPAITDPIAALQPGAALLHEHGNVIEEVRVVHGDPDARAEVVVEGEYALAMQDQAALGPEAGSVVLRALKANRVVCLVCDRDLGGDGVDGGALRQLAPVPGELDQIDVHWLSPP